MFGSDCTAALALTLAAMEIDARLWEMRGPDRWAGTLHRDVERWAADGIETAADLMQMLIDESERENRKHDLWDAYTPQELAEMEAAYALERAAYQAELDAAEAEREEAARFAIWDYDVDRTGRVRFAA